MASDLAVTRRAQVARYLDKAREELIHRLGYRPRQVTSGFRNNAGQLAFQALPAEWQEALQAFSASGLRYGEPTCDIETAIELGFITRDELLAPVVHVLDVKGTMARLHSQLQVAHDEDAVGKIVLRVEALSTEVDEFLRTQE